ncbi:MAG: Acyl-CoA dehydrogenase, partial [Acidimicrobiaceae bacterium]|nr:Acyl-CoA dehydrogenase [Acidimicrobiaceae bacterium]
MSQIRSSLDEFVQTAGADLPLPGSGATWRRFAVLAEWASRDLSLGRLCEGHADSLAILAEAGMRPISGATYGVWASRSKHVGTTAERSENGWLLSGTKEFCSGSGIIDRALVVATTNEGQRMFDISVAEQVSSVVPTSWPSVGMAASISETLEFTGPPIPDEYVVGPVDFYVNRPGFWFGATGVAACWYGGAVGLVNGLAEWISPEPSDFVLLDLGVAISALEAMRHALKSAADCFDDDRTDRQRRARFHALVTRQIVHDSASVVLDRVASAGGAHPLCHDEAQ